jgi:hypothetical protein
VKKFILLIFVLIVPSMLFASGNFSLWGGVAYPSLAGVNSALHGISAGYGPDKSIVELGNGITGGLDGAYWYYSWWGIGGRISYTALFDGAALGSESGNPVRSAVNGSLFQAAAGVPLLFEFFDGRMSLGGGVYAGFGYVYTSLVKTGGTPGTAGKLDDGMYCFVFEAPVRLTYHFSSSFLLDLNFSWKSAKTKVSDIVGYDMDFSGIMLGLGFNWRFSSKDWPWYNKKFSFSE